jgi:two-component system, cell cycle sensor histidine kinase and response regulator CckA
MNRLWRPMALKVLIILQVAGTVVLLGFGLISPEQGLPRTLVIASVLLCSPGLLVVVRHVRSEPSHSLVNEHASDLIMVLDTRSEGCCTYASPSYRRVLGYEPSTLVGQSATLLVHPADIGLAQERLVSVRPGTSAQATIRFRHADGTWRWVETGWSAARSPGTLSIVAVGRDVTEFKQLETRLAQLQQLDRIGRMAGGIAHDVNNLLSGISGCAELVSFALPASSPAQPDLEEIKRSAAGAADLMKQLLTSTPNQRSSFQPLNLNDLILGLEHLLRRLSGDGVDLVIVPAAHLEPISADPGQIERVLVNLVLNARAAMPNGGRLRIETKHIVIDERDGQPHNVMNPPSSVRLCVSDTGSGMDAATAARIFEPFFTTKALGTGTGIGLATCHEIVLQHGGTIGVTSALGRGTTFRIDLPCCVPAIVNIDLLTRMLDAISSVPS